MKTDTLLAGFLVANFEATSPTANTRHTIRTCRTSRTFTKNTCWITTKTRTTDSGKVAEAWFEGEGCVISQASASMLIERMEGKTIEEVKAFTAEEMLELFGPKLTPNRQKCCLLSWKILQSALHSPIGEDGDSSAPSGPSLGEEQ